MSESKFEILTSTESVIGKLKKYLELKNIEKIEVGYVVVFAQTTLLDTI